MNLKETNPSLLDYVMDFVRMNQLRMVQVCYLDGEYVEAPEAKREQAMRDA
jgi:hypothetical protein